MVEIIIRDEDRVKLDSFKVSQRDKKLQKRVGEILRSKYDIDLGAETLFEF